MIEYFFAAALFISLYQYKIVQERDKLEDKIEKAQVHLKDLDSFCHEVDEDKQKKCIESIEALKEILKERK